MSGNKVTIQASGGGTLEAYLALPAAGKGPGLLLLQEIFGVNRHMRFLADRYAEEGYLVVAPDLFWRLEPGVELGYSEADFQKALAYNQRFDVDQAIGDVDDTLKALRAMPECTGKVGAIGFCLGGRLGYLTAARTNIDCAISYYGVRIEASLGEARNVTCPMVLHFAGEDRFVPPAAVEQIRAAFASRGDIEIYVYPGADHAFNNSERPAYHRPSAWMAHSRSMAILRRVLGPQYDLASLWEKHCEHEFVTRDVEATMKTMVAEPYVNHIPVMTGGVGQQALSRFYKHHFIPKCPEDTKLVPISRTIGPDRLVDEMLFCFTHSLEIDWMLPGIPATGRYVEVPLVAIVNFRGDKLYHEHIYWDQASVLVQIGLLDPNGLPVTGAAQAKKLLDETLPSNTLMKRWAETEP